MLDLSPMKPLHPPGGESLPNLSVASMQNAFRYFSLTAALTLCSPAFAAPIDAQAVNTAAIASLPIEAPAEKVSRTSLTFAPDFCDRFFPEKSASAILSRKSGVMRQTRRLCGGPTGGSDSANVRKSNAEHSHGEWTNRSMSLLPSLPLWRNGMASLRRVRRQPPLR